MTWDVNFYLKSYREYSKVEKPVLVTMKYEGLDDEEELKMTPVVNNNNHVNIVSDSESDDFLPLLLFFYPIERGYSLNFCHVSITWMSIHNCLDVIHSKAF